MFRGLGARELDNKPRYHCMRSFATDSMLNSKPRRKKRKTIRSNN